MVKIANWLKVDQNRSNELSADLTNAESSLMLPSSVQDDMVVAVGSNVQPPSGLNLSRISFNEADPQEISRLDRKMGNYEHNLS